ncbi:hypothetical protein [Sabulibacter ruber]|uniref:hypothetical protein n=1 Tax=Sabulibacter ruber TaxID=2811901 RepID=UPI001A967ED1|nr:hypothetical protein [Sabulibacter ruber]
MKVLFTLGVGVLLGWLSSICDVEGQLALEQHQADLESILQYQAAAENGEEEVVRSGLFVWP